MKVFLVALFVALSMLGQSAFADRTLRADTIMPASNDLVFINTATADSLDIGTLQVSRLTVTSPGGIVFNTAQGIELSGSSLSLPASVSVESTSDTTISAAAVVDINGGDTIDIGSESFSVNSDSTSIRAEQISSTSSSIGFSGTDSLLLKSNNGLVTLDFQTIETTASTILVHGPNGIAVSAENDVSLVADQSVLIRSDTLSWTTTNDLSFSSLTNNVELLSGDTVTTTATDSISLVGTEDVTFVTRTGTARLEAENNWQTSSSNANFQATDSIEFFSGDATTFNAGDLIQFDGYSGFELIASGVFSVDSSTISVIGDQVKLFGTQLSIVSNGFTFNQDNGLHFSSDGAFTVSSVGDLSITADTDLTIDSTSRRDNSISFGVQTNGNNQDVDLLVDATTLNAVTRSLSVTTTTPLSYSYNSLTFASDNSMSVSTTVGASTVNSNTGAATTNINGGSVTFTSPNIQLNGNSLAFTAVSRPGQTIAITGTTLTSTSTTSSTINGGSVTFDASTALELSTTGVTSLSAVNDLTMLANTVFFDAPSTWSYDALQVVATGAGITLQNTLTTLTSTSDTDVTCVNFVYDSESLDISSNGRTDVRSLSFTQTSKQVTLTANDQISFFGIGQLTTAGFTVNGQTVIQSAPNGLVSIASSGAFSIGSTDLNIYNTRSLTVGQSALSFTSPTVSITNSNGPINLFASSVTYTSGSQSYSAAGDILLSGSAVSINPSSSATLTAANTLAIQSNGNFLITPTTLSVVASNQIEFNTQSAITWTTSTTSIQSNQIGVYAGSQINLSLRQTTFTANQILSAINNLYQTTSTSLTATATDISRLLFGTLVSVTATDDVTISGVFNAQANRLVLRAEGAVNSAITGTLSFFNGFFERGPITLETNTATFDGGDMTLTSTGRSDWSYTTIDLSTASQLFINAAGDFTQQAQNSISISATSNGVRSSFKAFAPRSDINFNTQGVVALSASNDLTLLAFDTAQNAKFNATTLGDVTLLWGPTTFTSLGSSFDPVLGRDYGLLLRSNNGPLLLQSTNDIDFSSGNQVDFIGVGGINIQTGGEVSIGSPVTINTGGQLSVEAAAGDLSISNSGDLHVASDGLLSISAASNLQITSTATTDPSRIGVKLYSSDGPITFTNANSATLDVTLTAGGAIIGQAGQSTTIQSSDSTVFTTTNQFWITSQGLLSIDNQGTLTLAANQQLAISSSLNNDISLNIGGAVAMNAQQISLNAVNDVAVTSTAIVSLVSSNTFSVLSTTSVTFDAITTTAVTSASSFNVTGTSTVNFDASTDVTIAVTTGKSGTLQINAGGNSLLNGVEINSSGNTVISGDAAVNLNAYSLSQHSSSTLGTTLQTSDSGSISLVSLGTFSGSQKDVLISSAGLLSASVGTSLDIGQSQLIFLQSGEVLSIGTTTASGPVSLSSQRFLDADSQNTMAITAAGWSVLTNKLQSTSFLSTTFSVTNSISLTPTGAFTSESSGPTTYSSTTSSVSIFSTANNSPISFITLADSSDLRVTSTGGQLVMTANSKLDVVAPFGSSYTSTSKVANDGILFGVANDFLVNSGGNLLLGTSAQLSFTAEQLTINSGGLQSYTVGTILSLQSTADTLYAADQDLTFQAAGSLSLSSAQTVSVVSGGNLQMSLPTWNLVASSTTLTSAANLQSTIAATTSTSLTTSQFVVIDAGGGVSINAKTLASFTAKATETIVANGAAGITVTSSAPLSVTAGQSANLLGSSVQIEAEGTEQATGYITLQALVTAAGSGLSVIANNSIQVDSLGGRLQLNYNTLQISSPIALSFAASGQAGLNQNAIAVTATGTNGAVSLSAGGLLELSGSQVNFEHIGGSLGSLSIAATTGNRAQFFMEANAANERGNSVELMATNGALSLSSSNGFGLFETDGLLRVDSQTGVTVASNAGDILISSDNYVGFLANTVESAANPPVAIVFDTYNPTANTVFTSQSNLDIGSGGSTNFVQSGSALFVTRQRGRLSLVSDENLTINTNTFRAVGMSDYSYLRGFEGVDLLSTGTIGFNGVVGVVANDRNLRQINRDKNLIIGGSELVYVASQAVFFSDIDVPNESNFILPTGNSANCAFGEFGYDEANALIYICGLVTIPVS